MHFFQPLPTVDNDTLPRTLLSPDEAVVCLDTSIIQCPKKYVHYSRGRLNPLEINYKMCLRERRNINDKACYGHRVAKHHPH